ncbi:MAG: hypothetical protein LUD17_12865 [Bacteroidales bacterium]|nr:hypothetical protein [Bacteroidales bacterium]
MWLKRWRRRRGYGVHSPFAYRFICSVITEELPYYDYWRLGTDEEKLLYRVAVFLQPVEIRSVGGGEIAAARLGCPKRKDRKPPRCIDMEATRLAVAGANAPEADVVAMMRKGYCVVWQHSATPEVRRALDELGCGMTFGVGHRMSIILPLPQLPRQDFKM